ncbi:MAG: ABC transporter permease, partial [Chloroflexota bacterium]
QILIWGAPLFVDLPHLPLVLDATPFLYSTAAAALALIVLVATLRPVLRLPLIFAGGSAARGDKQPWWQRYYVDVVLLVVGSAALFRLVTSGSPRTQTAVGGTTADPLLLVAPALLFVALGSITLRLFPIMADTAARFFSKRSELTGALAAWQVSREPAHYGRITFLLALAIGVGWFATSFQSTLAHSQSDQANYAVGADLRFSEHDNSLDSDRVQLTRVYAHQPNVTAASDALRLDNINFSLTGKSSEKGTILGVDSATFASAASWRSDLGSLPLPAAPDLSQTGVTLPSAPQRIGLWVRVQQRLAPTASDQDTGRLIPVIDFAVDDMNFSVRLRDASGAYLIVPLDPVRVAGIPADTDISQFHLNINPFMNKDQYDAEVERISDLTKDLSGWVYLEGALPLAPQGNTRLDTIYWRSSDQDAQFNQSAGSGATERILALSDLTLIAEVGTTSRFNILSDSGWETLLDDPQSATISTLKDEAHTGGRTITWEQKTDQILAGIVLNYPALDAIPVIVSKPFADENSLLSGATFDLFSARQRVHFAMQATTDYYPTLYAQQSPFLIADQATLLYMLNRRLGAAVYSNEAWIRLTPGVSSRDFLQQARLSALENNRLITQAQTLDDALHRLRTDALSLGLAGLLFIAFAVALALSVASLLTYTALTLQSRRSEFAVLRTLGFASSRVIASIALEQIFVFVTALLLGAVLGFLLSERVLPTLAFNTSGLAITPPFIVQVETPVLLQYGLILLLVLALVLVGSLMLVRRISLAQALRYGEE